MKKVIQLQRPNLTPIDIEPIWVENKIQLFDMYIEGKWIGSRRLLRYIEEEYARI